MDRNDYNGNYVDHHIKGSEPDRKNKALVIVLTAVAFLLLVIIFLISPLKEMFFPSQMAPAVTLVVVESGPSAERVGYQRMLVEAVVEGNPEPRVVFNRNDELSGEGDHYAILLLEEGETFLLKALATNSLGSTEAELELFAGITSGTASGRAGPAGPGDGGASDPGSGEGEDEPDDSDRNGAAPPDGDDEEDDDGEEIEGDEPANRQPVINSIDFSTDPLYAGEQFSVTVQATDPDRDTLSFQWRVDGVVVPGHSDNTRTWSSPAAGRYELEVIVSDGRGGEAEHSETVVVNPVSMFTPINDESGFLVRDFMAIPRGGVYAGDNSENRICRGYISFDTSSLAGAGVHKVELRLANPNVLGDPSFMHQRPSGKPTGLWIEVVVWAARPLQLSDYTLLGNQIGWHSNYNVTRTSVIGGTAPALAEALQTYLDAGYARFKLRLRFERETSNDDDADDGVRYEQGNIYLKVWHE